MKRTLTTVALAAMLVAGCTTVDPYTGERRPSHAGEGAVTGGIIGGVIGALARPHHAGTGALIGAGIGALAGAAIGASADQREAWWRYHMRYRHVMVTRHGERIVLSMRSDLLFDSGSADISPRADATLRRVAAMVRRHRQAITVYGFTDTVGSAQSNIQLSEARAEAVANVLAQYGVRDSHINTRGFGETHLRVRTPDDTDEPRNRRVEIVLDPYTG